MSHIAFTFFSHDTRRVSCLQPGGRGGHYFWNTPALGHKVRLHTKACRIFFSVNARQRKSLQQDGGVTFRLPALHFTKYVDFPPALPLL
jgi:hypothetical protein